MNSTVIAPPRDSVTATQSATIAGSAFSLTTVVQPMTSEGMYQLMTTSIRAVSDISVPVASRTNGSADRGIQNNSSVPA